MSTYLQVFKTCPSCEYNARLGHELTSIQSKYISDSNVSIKAMHTKYRAAIFTAITTFDPSKWTTETGNCALCRRTSCGQTSQNTIHPPATPPPLLTAKTCCCTWRQVQKYICQKYPVRRIFFLCATRNLHRMSPVNFN